MKRNLKIESSCLVVEGMIGMRSWGARGWKARYNKIVNASEITIRFYQEIFDEEGHLREFHQKYPMDTGHQTLEDD